MSTNVGEKEHVICVFCGEEIKGKTRIRSNHLAEDFCDLDCMDSRYLDYMGTMYIDESE